MDEIRDGPILAEDSMEKGETNQLLTRKQAYRSTIEDALTTDSITTPSWVSERSAQSPSPQIKYKPKHTVVLKKSQLADSALSSNIGAVARLALDGGLSVNQLMNIGANLETGHRAIQDSKQTLILQPSRFDHTSSTGATAITSSYTHVSRPTSQHFHHVPHCSTHQPIHLNRSRGSPTRGGGDRSSQQPLLVGFRPGSNYLNPRCAPLQMTRVGGLILNSSDSLSSDGTASSRNRSPTKCVPQKSLSTSTSPSAGKQPVTCTAQIFFSSPTNSPIPTSPTPVTNIIRIGPGNTISRGVPHQHDVADMIRRHGCPQPYVSYHSVGGGARVLDSAHTSAPQPSTTPIHVLMNPATEHSNRLSNCSKLPPTTSPEFLHSNPDPSLWTSPLRKPGSRASTSLSSPPAHQVARTVRHLRRIRHIYGDSLSYNPGSGTSASTGALTERDATSITSLVELRCHTSRSVESVRPASYVCGCSFPPDPSISPVGPSITNADGVAGLVPILKTGLVCAWTRFVRQIHETSHECSPWEQYHLQLTDDSTLIMTALSPSVKFNEEFSSSDLQHLHILLQCNTIQWKSVDQMDDNDSSRLSFDLNESSWLFGSIDLSSSVGDLTCHLLIDRSVALGLFGAWIPSHLVTEPNETSQTGSTPSSRFGGLSTKNRPKIISGRSSSLGVAGPAGAAPLFRAVGTAAASVGLPFRGWLDSTGRNSTSKPIEISAPIPLDDNPFDNVMMTESKLPTSTTTGLLSIQTESISDPTQSDKQKSPHIGRGRLHQALTRMRRTITASSDTPASPRRFTSSHASSTSSKQSGVDLVPISDTPSSSLQRSEGTSIKPTSSEPVTLSSPALLLATTVSPTPALRTPFMTFITQEPVNLIEASNSSLEQRIRSHDDLLKAPMATSGAVSSSSEYASGSTEHLSHSQESGSISPALFVPLPQSLTEPLPLHKCPRSTVSPFVPFIVELCVTLVERYGLNCVGLYRLSGSKLAHDFISIQLRKTLAEIDVTSDKWNDIHAICGVLKTFLRNLPDSLFPKDMYPDFLAACRLPQREKRLLSIQRLLGIMECYPHHPEYRAHRATLRYLATHLARISGRETVNKMTAYNLALVFAPNLVQPREDSPELLMSDSKYQILLVETIIKYHAWIFSPDLGIESGCTIPTNSLEDITSAVESEGTSRGPSDYGPVLIPADNRDSEDPKHQPGRLEGDLQPLIAELLNAASILPPPHSVTDLETAEEPGPSSDRPSDIAMTSPHRPRFKSIPSSGWHSTTLRSVDSEDEGVKLHPDLTTRSTLDALDEVSLDALLDSPHGLSHSHITSAHLGTKVDNLRHLSQGCIDQYTSEARRLGLRAAESKRQLERTVAQRLHAEQLLNEARNQQNDDPSTLRTDVPTTTDLPQASSTSHRGSN